MGISSRTHVLAVATALWLSACAPSLTALAAKGDLTAVSAHVAQGEDVNAKDGDGATPLLAAASAGKADIVRLLLEKGARVDARSYDDALGPTPLGAAAANGHLEVAKLLLEKGAAVDVKNDLQLDHGGWLLGFRDESIAAVLLDMVAGSRGWTPLMYSAFYARTEIAQLLVDKGADVNAENARRLTPWMLALFQPGVAPEEKYRQTAKLLVARGARPPKGSDAVVVFRSGAFFTDGKPGGGGFMIGGPKPLWSTTEIRGGLMNQFLIAALTSAGPKSLEVYYQRSDYVGDGTTRVTTGQAVALEVEAAKGNLYCVDYESSGATWKPRIDTYTTTTE